MGACGICVNNHDNYFNSFFNTFRLKSITDSEYVGFIENIISKKTSYYNKLKLENNKNKDEDRNRYGTRSEDQGTNMDDASSTEFMNNFNYKQNKVNDNNEEDGSVINLDLVQENLQKYQDELVQEVLNTYCFHTNLVAPTKDELFPDSEEKHYLNDYVVKKEANKYFEFYQKFYKKQNKSLQFITALLFFTRSSFKTISKYLNKIFMLFFNIEILNEENNCLYINMSLIKEVCEIYIRMSSCNSIEFIAAILPQDLSPQEFQHNYKQIFAEKVINFFVENYFEFNFSQEISLAYFVKVIYVKIECDLTVRKSLQETYTENKNFNDKVIRDSKEKKTNS